jgi:hypothetical protein
MHEGLYPEATGYRNILLMGPRRFILVMRTRLIARIQCRGFISLFTAKDLSSAKKRSLSFIMLRYSFLG